MAAKSMPSDYALLELPEIDEHGAMVGVYYMGCPVRFDWIISYPPNCYSTVREEEG